MVFKNYGFLIWILASSAGIFLPTFPAFCLIFGLKNLFLKIRLQKLCSQKCLIFAKLSPSPSPSFSQVGLGFSFSNLADHLDKYFQDILYPFPQKWSWGKFNPILDTKPSRRVLSKSIMTLTSKAKLLMQLGIPHKYLQTLTL